MPQTRHTPDSIHHPGKDKQGHLLGSQPCCNKIAPTPSPWAVQGADMAIVGQRDNLPVCIGRLYKSPSEPDGTLSANAALIAAAPEMLQVLREELTALQTWQSAKPVHPEVREGIAISISKIDQTIHKATGR